jgi:hypothetical protein
MAEKAVGLPLQKIADVAAVPLPRMSNLLLVDPQE